MADPRRTAATPRPSPAGSSRARPSRPVGHRFVTTAVTHPARNRLPRDFIS